MLDPSLPWLATGYRKFKEKDFCRPHSATHSTHRYLENGSNQQELRPTTPSQHLHRRVKSATYGRVQCGTPTIKHRLSSRPRSARSTENFKNEKVGCYNFSPETVRALARRPKSASAVLLRQHRPSAAQNKSVTQVERFHHTQEQLIRQYEKVTGEEVQHSCAFCPVACRPTSSSSHRPTSSTGLLAAHLPSHHDRRYNWTRPKTAPITKREISSLPRHNNVQRGRVPYYTNFVSKLPLHLHDRTPSPPAPRRRQAFQEEAPPPVVNDEEEEAVEEVEDDFLEEDINIEDDIAEPVVEPPSPTPPPALVEEELQMEPPTEAMEAWSLEIIAPTPTPSVSRRNSEQEQLVIERASTPIPSPPPSPIQQQLPEKPSSPPPITSPTPPPPKSPSPPPKSPTPPPPPELSIKPPRECVHKPKPPVPPLPKVKKEVRIQEPPKDLPKEKPVVKKEKKPIQIVNKSPPEEPSAPVPLKPSLKKPPSEAKIKEVTPSVKIEPPPLPTLEPEPTVEPPVKPLPNKETKVEEEKAPDKTDDGPPATQEVEEKKKLGPPPTKVKVDMFGMDPQSIKQLLDLQMRAKRQGGNQSDDEDGQPPPGLASLLEPTTRMLKQSDWLRGRIALSRRAARFELPMDVGDLAEMSPVEYLRRHCIISQRRRALYKKAFVKVDKDNDGKINRKEVEKAVLDALVDTIQPDKVAVVLGYLGAEGDTVFTSRFFGAFCALLERLYYREFTKDDVGEKKDTKEKEILEEADFSGLDWKLHGQYVNPPLKSLLYML